jgi:hypothetical protein
MRKIGRIGLGVAVCALLGGAALADWNPGDFYKTANPPQLPDPTGWDVCLQDQSIADDFMCGETGPITDVHFWFSYEQDVPSDITGVQVSIHSDIPVGGEYPYSRPGQTLWSQNFTPAQFTTRWYGTGDQGWYCPSADVFQRPDHTEYYQLNITGIENPFIQTQGVIYWLDITVLTSNPNQGLGWKTSQDHWNDVAVWRDPQSGQWQPMYDPEITENPLDMAFVITPEPATLLMLGAVGLLLRRR